MNQILEHTRFAAALALSSLVGSAGFASEASTGDSAIEAVDPDTITGAGIAVDPNLPQPYGADFDTRVTGGSQPEADLPPLPGAAESAPRQPAARTIAQPVVQPAPPPSPTFVSDDPFVVKSILPIEGTIRYGEWYWDESRAPKTGKLVMTVDLDARVISVFRDGHEIGTAVALLGTQKHPTPLGSFPILTKEKDNVSEKYNNAPMPWSLRLTWDGIMIHGSPVLNGYASHGCVGVPNDFAEKLFAIAKRGDRVIITRGETLTLGDKIVS